MIIITVKYNIPMETYAIMNVKVVVNGNQYNKYLHITIQL